jgi:N-methylhydantoinase A
MFKVAVDIGGTFTDCAVADAHGAITASKALTTPDELDQGVLDAISANAEQRGMTCEELLGDTELLVHGTTQATNALLTRQGAHTGLITTRGHEDALIIGKVQSKVAGLPERELIHASRVRKPDPVVPRQLIRGITERIDRDGAIVVPLDEDDARAAIASLLAAGAEAIAVSLLWSFENPAHERRVAELIAESGADVHVALSHEVSPVLGEYERTATTAISAYVGPRVAGYLERLQTRLAERGFTRALLVMQASGGLTTVPDAVRRPIVTLDSGPTGGILGSRHLGELIGEPNLICTDVGGTSFDVGLVLGGRVPIDPEPVVGQYTLRMPKVLVESIGSGGGSIAWIDAGGLLRVGPRSAGSAPGPACYGRGGTEATVTDADLVLGHLDPDGFVGGRMRLDRDLARRALGALGTRLGLEPEEVAIGIARIVNSQMADLVRKSTIEQGHDPRECVLVAYGGAGPTHAAAYGADLGAKDIRVPRDSTVFSAEGMLTCDLIRAVEATHRAEAPLGVDGARALAEHFATLRARALGELPPLGTGPDAVSTTHTVGVRFRSQVHTIPVDVEPEALDAGFDDYLAERFVERYRDLFGAGAVIPGGGVEIAYLRVIGRRAMAPLPFEVAPDGAAAAQPVGERDAYFEGAGFVPTRVYAGDELRPGDAIAGPAILERMGDSVVVPPGHLAAVDGRLTIRLAPADARPRPTIPAIVEAS